VRELYLIEIDDRLPKVISLPVEISHSDLSKVTWMVLVHVCSVVMLTTSKTSTTGMLAVLAYTTVSGRDMTATVKILSVNVFVALFHPFQISSTT
jgi:hypothetical protein